MLKAPRGGKHHAVSLDGLTTNPHHTTSVRLSLCPALDSELLLSQSLACGQTVIRDRQVALLLLM